MILSLFLTIMIDFDLSNPVNQVRVLIGDADVSLISDDNIDFVLTQVDGDIMLAAEKCLEYILAYVATFVREESGDVEVYWNEMYEKIHDRLDDIKKDNRYKNSNKLFFFGGTVKSEADRVRSDLEDTQYSVVNRKFYEAVERLGISLDDPYLLERRW